jgi:cyclopropane fatty-acyl-phospholipid synthase-like methyltransferase
VEAVSTGWLPSGSTVLDVGCGRGENAAWLASQGFRVTGIDVSQAALSYGEINYLAHHQNLRFRRVDVAVPTELGTFDIVTDIGCFHCLPPDLHRAYAENICRWSHRGTRLIILSHTLKVSANQQQDLLVALLTPKFDIESVDVTPNPRHASSFRMLMRLERRS